MEAAQMFINRPDKDVVHMHSGLFLRHKKSEILPFETTWMDVEGIMPSDISQTEKDKYHIFVKSTKQNK